MAARASWKGYLRLSLVACPIALDPGTSDQEKVHFHRINKKTGHRVHMQNVDAETGEVVDKDELGRGYETSGGRIVPIDDEELASLVTMVAEVLKNLTHWLTHVVLPFSLIGRLRF